MTFEQLLQMLGTGGHGFPAALAITFAAGIMASAICPCTLPVGLGIAGIVLSLAMLGTLAGQLGALATEAFGRDWALAMAVVSLAAAVVAFWWPRMRTDRLAAWRRPGLVGAFGYGLVFSVGTSVAPLVLLLTVAAADGRAVPGALLALVFGLGRGVPFLAAGLAASAVTRLARLGLWGRTMQIVSGVTLLTVSGYYAQVYVALL